tara:strand:- start:3124 stop:5106 length:1983 start_codon:yes stop_codon:yes gene_type:complete
VAKPHIEVLVDWNDDGDFGDSDEDITSDVLRVSLDHFRDMKTEYMDGRIGTLELKNDDHKYSPSKGTITGLKPGRPAWIKAWYPYDAFTGDANTALSAHTPDEDSDFTWVDPTARNFELDGSGAARTDSGGSGYYLGYLEFNDTDVTIACDFKRGTDATDHGGILLRYVDSSNYGHVRVDGSTIKIFENVAGVHNEVSTANHTWADSTSKFLEIRVHGTSVRIFVDRVEIAMSNSGTMDDAAFNAGTKHGLISSGVADHTWDNFGGYRSLFFGRIDKIRPRPKTGAEYCYIELIDEFELFKRDLLTGINGLSDNTRSDSSLDAILDNIAFSATKRQLEQATILMADLDEGLKALVDDGLSTIYRLQDEEDGFIYVDTDGFVTLEKREHRTNVPHTVSRATYKDTYDGSNPAFADLAWDDGIEAVENHIIVKYSRADKTSAQLWKSEQASDTALAIPIDASETMDFIIEVRDYDAAFSWTTPVASTDYLVNTQADGGGIDKTAQVTVSFQNTGTILGKFHHLRVVNNDASAYFITLLKVRGVGITYQDVTSMEDADSASQTAVGERRKIITCLFIDREQAAQDLATNRKDRRKDAKTQLMLTLASGDKHTLRNMIQRRLSDRVTVSYSDMGISEDFFVEGESWVIDEGGTMVEQQLQLRGV